MVELHKQEQPVVARLARKSQIPAVEFSLLGRIRQRLQLCPQSLEFRKTIDLCCLIHLFATEIDRSSAANGTVALDKDDLFVFAHRLSDFVRHDQRSMLEADAFGFAGAVIGIAPADIV